MTNSFLAPLIARLAEKALLYEVALSPKPGLVDRHTNGAHEDMNFLTFLDSIVSLTPFFQQYFEAGFRHQGTLTALFNQLRKIGITAEKAMLAATKNTNTHKGANFSLAVILGATGYYLQKKQNVRFPLTPEDSQAILVLTSQMTQQLVKEDFQHLQQKKKLSYGEKLYLDQGITGIRGEAAAGYPSLSHQLLPFLRSADKQDIEETLLRALLFLMSEVEDGNLLHRGGVQAWKEVKAESKKIHQATLPKKKLLDELVKYDRILTNRHLSPGGSADLLSLGIYFAQLEGLF